MDRNIVYPGSIPLDTDLLNVNRNAMVALGVLIAATLGVQPVIDGLAVTPTTPQTLEIVVAPGSITQITALDQTGYGSLPADTQDPLVKMGVNIAPTFLTCATPASAGESINYLVEAAFAESDANPIVLPYYNAANPAQPYLGPSNSGAAQPTSRIQRVQLVCKPGIAGPTGSQTTPAADPGYVGLAVVSIAYGQSQIASGNISVLPTVPKIPFKLPFLRPGFSALQAFTTSGVFVVPAGVTTAKVTVIGGGGAGGLHSSLPSGGGGAGGQAIKIVSDLGPGLVVPITVGAGGAPPGVPAQGGAGGSSSFGTYVSATGGQGGMGGTIAATNAGGAGGLGVGGDINYGGGFGTDAITMAPRGGDGGGPGSGRGTSGLINGIDANGFGGGGGGGGASQAGGGGTGAPGGNGFPGLVVVEF